MEAGPPLPLSWSCERVKTKVPYLNKALGLVVSVAWALASSSPKRLQRSAAHPHTRTPIHIYEYDTYSTTSVIITYTVFIIYQYSRLHIAQFHTTPGVQDSYDQAERDLVTSGIDSTAGASSTSSRGTPAAFGLGV